MTRRNADPPRADRGLAIAEVSRLLGLPAPTLRSWERRYGIPATARSVGGHRRYTDEALHQLRLMRDEIARGRSAAAAAESVRLLLRDQDLVATGHVRDLLAASERLDPAGVRSVLDAARDDLGIAAAIDAVMFPTMRQIGGWWETGRCDIAQEHLTTEAARGWLSRLGASAPAPVRHYPIVIACGPRDLHTLGGEALAVLLAYSGHSCRMLGARTPAKTLVTAVQATSAAAAVVISHLASGRRPAADAIRAVGDTGCPVFYAGNALAHPRSRSGLPGIYLGENIALAAARIDEALGP